MNHRSNWNDLTGRTFGRLTVVEYAGRNQHGSSLWHLRCECGREVIRQAGILINGLTRSCGCLRRELTVARLTTRARSYHDVYPVWNQMIARCYNPKNPRYPSYGGRGITVCDRWRDSIDAFITDMGPRPVGGTIERRDNDGPYHPDNCHWVPHAAQAANKRTNRVLELDGESKTIAEWARTTGIKPHTIAARIRLGWSVRDALTRPLR